MPELPEAETIKRILEAHLTGRKIVSVAVNNPQMKCFLANSISCYTSLPHLRRYFKIYRT